MTKLEQLIEKLCPDGVAYGVEQEEWHGNALEVSYFESDAEKFKVDNVPSKEEISKHITALYEQMRKDLGSNIK